MPRGRGDDLSRRRHEAGDERPEELGVAAEALTSPGGCAKMAAP